jgi:hypothetical protein
MRARIRFSKDANDLIGLAADAALVALAAVFLYTLFSLLLP